VLAIVVVPAAAQDSTAPAATVAIAYITQKVKQLPPLSLVDQPGTDEGLLGARIGIDDNMTTGKFTNQTFELAESVVPEGGDVAAAFRDLYAKGQRLFVVDLPAASLLKLADLPEAKDAVLFNVQAKDDALRGEQCRANLLHLTPSYAMLADALAQYLIWKRWTDWFLVVGTGEEDKKFADAVRRAAKRFRAEIVEERSYNAEPGARRTDTGSVQIQKQMPVFTQNVDYQVLVVADEQDAFGQYLPYRTWDPRPVVGTHGLWPTAWWRAHELWGATQMQNRFTKVAGRWMTERDYAAWLAVRSIGEAATQTKKTDAASLAAYIRSPDFAVAGFKGQKLTFRDWDGQLRQPILLAEARTIVSVSPQEGFKHQTNVLDTLGVDKPDTTCKLK
jgi:ABC transporter substrate binding protein (PQQ-dependent alcohol dehydrogenase system)